MEIGKHNPKALRIEGLEQMNKKVTIGFKCDPKIKFHLASEAKKIGITLSEFIETLILQLDAALQLEKKETESLRAKLSFYESDQLLKMFKEHEKQEIEFVTSDGKSLKILIKEPKDIFTVLINSFKLKK